MSDALFGGCLGPSARADGAEVDAKPVDLVTALSSSEVVG